MSQSSNFPTLNFDNFYSLLESELSRMEGGNAVLTRKALLSLRRAAVQIPEEKRTVTEAVEVWKAAMAAKGVSRLTSRRYLESIRALHNRALQHSGIEGEETLDIEPVLDPATESCGDALRSLRAIARRSRHLSPAMRLPVDVLLFSILSGGCALEDTIALRINSEEATALNCIPLLRDIADRYAAPRRKFLFPLSQGRFTDHSIARSLTDKILALLPLTGGDDIMEAVAHGNLGSIFVEVALQAGLTILEIRDLLGERNLPGSLSFLNGIRPSEISVERRIKLLDYLCNMIFDTRPRWYAMRLRHGVKPEDIASRISASGDPRRRLTIYYPVEEITRRVGKKITTSTRAYISDILFFRSDPAEVRPLFLLIGDVAWCYRTTPSPSSPYAAISDREMTAFRQRIERFSEDMEIDASSPSLFEIGQKVKVTGGPLEGYEGTVLTLPGGIRRQLRLLLTPDRGLSLTLDIPDSYLSPL